MYSLTLMKATATRGTVSPLADLLRSQVDRVLERWEAGAASPGREPGKAALRRFIGALDEVVEAAGALSAPEAQAGQPHRDEAATPRVLLVTDDPAEAAELTQALGSGFRVEVAGGAEAAVRKAGDHTPSLLFASGAAALSVVERVRKLVPALPVIVVAPERDVLAAAGKFRTDPAVVLPAGIGTEAIAVAIRALLAESGMRTPEPDRPALDLSSEPKSYAHLTGLLPRALERSVAFDAGAAVIARPGEAPLVDVHGTSECSEQTLQVVRERALQIFSIVSGRAQRDGEEARIPPPSPFRSSIYVPLATEGRVVGLTYLASFRPDAFSGQDEVITELAAHASGAYRRLEASVSRLRLTPRQSQVLALIASGLSDKEVATRLGLAHRTVRTHIDRLLREHGLRSRTEAVAAWLRGQQG